MSFNLSQYDKVAPLGFVLVGSVLLSWHWLGGDDYFYQSVIKVVISVATSVICATWMFGSFWGHECGVRNKAATFYPIPLISLLLGVAIALMCYASVRIAMSFSPIGSNASLMALPRRLTAVGVVFIVCNILTYLILKNVYKPK